MEQAKPATSLQMEMLALLAFFDQEGKYVRSVVDLELYDSKPVQSLARDLYDFIDNFQSAPKEHFGEIFSKYLQGTDKELYEQIYSRLMKLRTGVNPSYVTAQLDEFLATQTLYLGITKAFAKMEKKDTEGAKRALYEAVKTPTVFSDPGLYLSQALPLIYAPDTRLEFTTGIRQLDERRFTPARGEYMMLLGLSGKGKTWGLIHIGAANARIGKKVLHISLEMGKRQCATRYVQNMMFLCRGPGQELSWFELHEGPGDEYIPSQQTRYVYGLLDKKVMENIGPKMSLLNNIVIQTWPGHALTIPKLETYLDMLAQVHGFMPDIILVDYPDIFKLGKKEDKRNEIGNIIVDLRRIAQERNLAVVAPSQSNRGGKGKAILTEEDIAEDYSKYMTADCACSFNATNEEYRIGVMRVFVLKNRDDADRFGVVINQRLEAGQFAVSSAFYHESGYKNWLAQFSGDLAG